MKYILIDPTTFEISVTSEPQPSYLVIPANLQGRREVLRSRLASIVYFEVLYPCVWREDRRRGVENVAYCLVEPDVYLIALAAIIWEGFVQGLSYDLIKTFVLSGLQRLQTAGLAPSGAKITKKTRLRFTWTSYAKDGRKRREMFLDLKRAYEKLPKADRVEVTASLKPPEKRRNEKR